MSKKKIKAEKPVCCPSYNELLGVCVVLGGICAQRTNPLGCEFYNYDGRNKPDLQVKQVATVIHAEPDGIPVLRRKPDMPSEPCQWCGGSKWWLGEGRYEWVCERCHPRIIDNVPDDF